MITASEEVQGEVREEVSSLPRARVHTSARKDGNLELLPEVPSLAREEDVRSRAVTWLASAQAVSAGLLEKPGTLLHAQPPTFRQAHARHHECAGHYGYPLAHGPRVVYGYAHMLVIKAPLNYIEWATDSPLRGAIHVLLGLAVWAGLLLGGYL